MKTGQRNECRPSFCILTVSLIAAVIMLVFLCVPSLAAEAHSGTSGSIKWELDTNGKLTFSPVSGSSGTFGKQTLSYTSYSGEVKDNYYWPWWEYRKDILTAEFTGTVYGNSDMSRLFADCSKLQEITGMSHFNTGRVTDMTAMFDGCNSLREVDVSHFNTSQVTGMGGMFNNCSSLKTLDVSGFNTRNVYNFFQMFSGCSSLTSLDLRNFSTAGAGTYTFGYLFDKCSSLETLDLSGSGFNTKNLVMGNYCFRNTYQLKKIILGSNFSFKGKVTSYSDGSALMKPSGTEYTGKWTNGSVSYTPEELRDNYNASLAGTWTWEKRIPYVVRFDANGGSGTMQNEEFYTDQSKALSGNTFSRDGYRFSGWNTKKDGTGTGYSDRQKVNNIASDGETIVLYAQWKKITTYRIRFDPNGGTGTISSITCTVGKDVTLPDNADNRISRTGYAFQGWNTRADGTGTTYEGGALVRDLAEAGGEITLYALWNPSSYIVTIPASISYTGMNVGSVQETAEYDISVKGSVTPGQHVSVSADAKPLSYGSDSILMTVRRSNDVFSADVIQGNGRTVQDQILLSGTAKSVGEYSGVIIYTSVLEEE